MRAALLRAPGVMEITAAPRPVPGPGEVRVRLQGCGVCASNLAAWAGQPWFQYPFAPGEMGHEGYGIVDAVGPGVTTCAAGDRVALLSNRAYAEYDLAPAESVLVLPPALDAVPFPGEPLGCAMNILARSGIQPGHSVAIIGIGFLGALLTELVTGLGARVIALGRRAFARELAAGQGAAHVLAMDDHYRIIEEVKGLTGGAFCDVVLETAGHQWPLDLAGELTRERGRLVIAGYHQDGPRQVNMQLWNWRGLDVINAHERDPAVYQAGLRAAIEAVVAGRLHPERLYTHLLPLAQLGEALTLTKERPDGFLKAIVTMP